MANDKKNINKLVDNELVENYCQIANRPSSGPPVGRSPEVASDKDLTDQLSKCEEYADQLRWKIRDLQAIVSVQLEQLSKLEKESGKKFKELAQVKALLTSAKKIIPELHERNELAEKRHAREILALHVQLENSDSSFGDADIQNQELAHQLLHLHESRESLRREGQTRNIKTERRIKALNTKCKKLARQKAEYKEQIDAKNKAIHGLLSQLAPRSSPDDNEPDLDNTVQVIDYGLYGPLRDESDDNGSTESEDTSDTADDLCRRELVGRIDGSRMCFSITKDRLTIGRTLENDIQLTPSYISRHHAIIVTEDGSTRVVDSGSKNGVFVNYQRVKDHSLSNGDVVAVGFAKFIYREQPQAEL